MPMKSVYSIRMYELLHSKYTVDYKGIKKGRTVEEIEFIVKGINF